MRAFEVYLNDEKLCVAGVGEYGVLTAIVDYVGNRENETSLHVGGLITPRNEHVRWRNRLLQVGDEVRIRIVDAKSIDRPTKRYRRDPVKELRSQKRYVREMAKKFGWRLTTRRHDGK